jgi:hypothetical protein
MTGHAIHIKLETTGPLGPPLSALPPGAEYYNGLPSGRVHRDPGARPRA